MSQHQPLKKTMQHMSDSETNRPKRRLRLAPQARMPLILDAALQEFSRRGFTAARMDDIAQRCGLSKGGLYAHFDSKDAIFKALIDRTLHRTDWTQMPQLATGTGTRAVAEWIVDRLQAALLAPDVITLLRLLIPERERVPLRVDEWKNLTQLHTQQVTAVISENLKAGGRQDSVLARHPWLALSPMVHVLLWHAVFGEGSDPDPLFRQAHVDMLCELLA